MSGLGMAKPKIEGRIWLRPGLLEGGRYLAIPKNGPSAVLLSVQETGCGTGRVSAQQLQTMRVLSPASADLLAKIGRRRA